VATPAQNATQASKSKDEGPIGTNIFS